MTVRFNGALMAADAASRGWSGSTLASKADVSQMTVSRLFRGVGNVRPETVAKLAEALDHPVERYILESESVAS